MRSSLSTLRVVTILPLSPVGTLTTWNTPFYVLEHVQILRLEERPGRAIPKPRVAITPAIPYAFTVTFMQVVTLSCPPASPYAVACDHQTN